MATSVITSWSTAPTNDFDFNTETVDIIGWTASLGALLALLGPLYGSVSIAGVETTELAVFASFLLSMTSAASLIIRKSGFPDGTAATLAVLGLLMFPLTISRLRYELAEIVDPRYSSGIAEVCIFGVLLLNSLLVPWRSDRVRRTLSSVLWFAFVPYVVLWIATGAPTAFEGLANHKNGVGGSALVSFVALATVSSRAGKRSRATFWLQLVITLAAFASGSRTALVGIGIVWVSQGVNRNAATQSIRASRAWAYGLLLFSFVTLPIYLGLFGTTVGNWLDRSLVGLTGSGLYTGRQRFWLDSLALGNEKMVVGHGYHFVEIFSTKTLHMHNIYLAKYFQVGLFGLICFILSLAIVGDRCARVGQPVLLGAFGAILFHQTFEVNLTIGGPPMLAGLAVCLGLLLGAGSFSTNESRR